MTRSLLLGLFALACAPQQQAAPPEPQSATPVIVRTPGQEKLERARRLRGEAEAIAPPVAPSSFESKTAALAFAQGPVATWIRARRPAIDRAVEAYSAALSELSDAEASAAALEVGEMWLAFAGTVQRLMLATMPRSISDDAELAKAFRGAISEAVAPQYQNARAAFEVCIAKGASSARGATVQRCGELLARLPTPPTPSARTTETGSSPRPSVEAARPWVATTQPKPCTFAGTLAIWRASLSSVPGGPEVALLQQVELDALQLPAKRGEPFRLATRWPVQGTFYLSLDERPLELKKRIDLVPGHIWLAAGAAVSAAASGVQALVFRTGDRPASTPDTAKVVPCGDLTLPAQADSSQKPEGKAEFLTFEGRVPLHAGPGQAGIGVLELGDPFVVTVLQRRAGWSHITWTHSGGRGYGSDVPFDFDAWTPAKPSEEGGYGMIGLLAPNASGTHETTATIDVYLGPGEGKPLGKLALGVPLLVGETRAGWVNIGVAGLEAAMKRDWGFWIGEADFKRGVRAK